MTETKESIITHVISVEMVDQERVLCQEKIMKQYDEYKIDEKKLAIKLKDNRSHAASAKDAIGRMRELADVI